MRRSPPSSEATSDLRLRGRRVPAHPPAPRRRAGDGARQGDRRQRSRPASRSATSWASATRCPQAIEQLGARCRLDRRRRSSPRATCRRYNVIVTGVRAYERRQDLRANNQRLLQYAENGGTVIVQYNKQRVQRGAVRAVPGEDQHRPRHRRERADRDPGAGSPGLQHAQQDRARDLGAAGCRSAGPISSASATRATSICCDRRDPFPYNAGAKTGALVEARVGKGRWIYIGLGLWRQLPAGTDGAYRLMANLLSLRKAQQADEILVPTTSASSSTRTSKTPRRSSSRR